MNQTNKIFQILYFCMLILFFIEMVVLFCNIDLIPLILIGIVCGFIIIIRNSNDDFFYATGEIKETRVIFKFIFMSIVNILIFTTFLVYGIENISNNIVLLLNTNHIIRFVLYGLIYPVILSYFMAWFWTDNRPSLSILYAIVAPNSLGHYYKFLFITACIGLFVCIHWDSYYMMVSSLLQLFS